MSDVNIVFKKKREQIEYCSVDCCAENIVQSCNQQGKQCWQLCGIVRDGEKATLIFARTKMSQNES